jgi:branched-chain amino acid transport system substrate-binding protein
MFVILNQYKNMKTSQKIIAIAVIGLVLIIGLVAKNSKNEANSTKPIIKIGVTLPLTGDIAMLGQSNKNAIELAYNNLDKTKLKYDYQLVFEDDQFKPLIGATTANKLINIDGSQALISFGSPVGNAVNPIAESAGVPHINDFASDPHVASGQFNFVDYTPASEDSKLFIQELNSRGIKKLIFFGQQDNPGATAIINTFLSDIKKSDIQVLSTQMITTGTRDFRTQIEKVKNLGADIYVLVVTSPELEIITKQLREAGIRTPVTTMETFEFSSDLSLFEGMWYVNDADPMSWFVEQYSKTYGQSPKFGAANGYDVLNMIVKSFEEAGDGKSIPSRSSVRDVIAGLKNFNGALGDGLYMSSDHIVDSKSVVRMIKNGTPVTISK